MSEPKLLNIPLSCIRENPVALRGVEKDEVEWAEFVDSIKKNGILNPISVREIEKAGDGTQLYSVCDGLHRFTGANDAGLDSIPCLVVSKSDAEVEEAQIITNFQKFDTKPAAYAKQLNRLLARNPDMTMTELSGRLSMSVTKLGDLLNLVKLDAKIQALVDEGKIKLVSAVALSKMPAEMQADFVERAMTMTSTEFVPTVQQAVKAHRDALRAGKTPGEVAFQPVQLLQKLSDIKAALGDYKSLAQRLISTNTINSPEDIVGVTLAWVLRSDADSVKSQKDKWDAEQAEKAAKKAAAKAEREKKKADAAKADAATVTA